MTSADNVTLRQQDRSWILTFESGTKIKFRSKEEALDQCTRYQLKIVPKFAKQDERTLQTIRKAREFTRAKKRLIMKTTRRGGVPLATLDRKGGKSR